MIRLFNVYYPVRTLVLLAGEALVIWTSFLLATVLRNPEKSYVLLNYENGYYKILADNKVGENADQNFGYDARNDKYYGAYVL